MSGGGLKRIAATVATAVVAATSCGASNPVEPDAQPVVNVVRSADIPRQYEYVYMPASPSPFLACLDGVDWVEASVDWDRGIIRLQPRRDAPAIFVTDEIVVVMHPGTPDVFAWSTDLDSEPLADVFGTSVATFIETGTRAPDPNTTIEAMLDIAVDVRVAPTPVGIVGQTITITVDPDRFNAGSDREAGQPAPAITATVDGGGLVTGYVVSDPSAASQRDVAANYSVLVDYAPSQQLSVPDVGSERLTIDEVDYPTAQDSCEFEG